MIIKQEPHTEKKKSRSPLSVTIVHKFARTNAPSPPSLYAGPLLTQLCKFRRFSRRPRPDVAETLRQQSFVLERMASGQEPGQETYCSRPASRALCRSQTRRPMTESGGKRRPLFVRPKSHTQINIKNAKCANRRLTGAIIPFGRTVSAVSRKRPYSSTIKVTYQPIGTEQELLKRMTDGYRTMDNSAAKRTEKISQARRCCCATLSTFKG